MATMAAIRATLLVGTSAASPIISMHTSSDFASELQSSQAARCCMSSRSSPPSFSSSLSSPAAVRLSSSSFSSCLSSSGSIWMVSRESRRKIRLCASPRCESESNDDGKTPFGYTRKDVILIGVGLLSFGVGLKYGLEFLGVDSIKAGNAVQLIMVLCLTLGWISTYIFRVSTKEMTYAQQLRDYENKVMQKRLEELPEAELESMLAQVEEEKRILQENREKLR